jgi:hypothetical protein
MPALYDIEVIGDETKPVLDIVVSATERGLSFSVGGMALTVLLAAIVAELLRPGSFFALVIVMFPFIVVKYVHESRQHQSVSVDGMFVSGEYSRLTLLDSTSRWEVARDTVEAVEYANGPGRRGAVWLRCSGRESPRQPVTTLPLPPARREQLAQLVAEELAVPCEKKPYADCTRQQ